MIHIQSLKVLKSFSDIGAVSGFIFDVLRRLFLIPVCKEAFFVKCFLSETLTCLDILRLRCDICITELRCDNLRSVDHRLRNSRKTRHIDAIGPVGASRDYLTEEHYVLIVVCNRDTVIVHALKLTLKLCELMIVGSKKSFRLNNLCDIFNHRPGNAETVKGTGSSSYFIQNKK